MKYNLNGFRLDRVVAQDGLIPHPIAAAITFTKGQIVVDDGSGYATNVGTSFANTFLGICAGDADNAAGAAGALNVLTIPPRAGYSFWVKNESATVAAQTDVGEIIDLESNDGVDVTDTTCTAWGFMVEEIDISAAALVANAGGFVRGRFQIIGA